MNSPEQIFLVPSLEQPRVLKRIIKRAKTKSTQKIKVFAFTRNIHRVNNFSKLDEVQNISYEIIGSFDDSNLANRFFLYLKLLWILYGRYGFLKKNVYVFGFDLRLISSLLFNKHVSYEISDIMWLYKPKVLKIIFKTIDYYLTQKSQKVIFTSKGFYDKYFSFLKEDLVSIEENRFQTYGLVNAVFSLKLDKIRIAYIGAFRYTEIIDSLIQSCSVYKDRVILNFYGDGAKLVTAKLKAASETHNNVNYWGPFKNPEDLEEIYRENNLNFVAYDNKKENEKVAMPNKFYESGYFNIPIVCSANTYVGQRVLELNMGWVIEPTMQGIDIFLRNLTIEEIVEKHYAIKKIDKDLFEQR